MATRFWPAIARCRQLIAVNSVNMQVVNVVGLSLRRPLAIVVLAKRSRDMVRTAEDIAARLLT